ncbi:GT23 domain-containing protein [Meloidogyne graminicola]|uniref:GT23 domain-containing protein n=1 Tax=Meloidogyne graminicola TaxID=189291 RepID=A0A8S9ZJX3_9BILA|nr:GT23 domain-containing protein [Meloidogyne graminicola]
MTLIQKRVYLQKLFRYDETRNDEQKQIIDKKIIMQLSTENRYHIKYKNTKQLSFLSEKIQSIIDLLQNPMDCSKARIIVCPIMAEKCGLGCLIHQIGYCLALGSRSGRTVILDSDETKIYGFNIKWNELFEPITNCSFEKHVKPFLPLNNYAELPENSDRIVMGWLINHQLDLMKRVFDAAPMEIKDFLCKFTANPVLWFRGQLMKYVLREKEKTLRETNQTISKIPFECEMG